jgi:hypothetical protein
VDIEGTRAKGASQQLYPHNNQPQLNTIYPQVFT